jgi:SAM-dependent methyltransferase
MEPSLISVLRNRWRDTRSRKSLTSSLQEISADIWEFVKESTPQRRRARFGDLDYDWDHAGMNTTSATVSWQTGLLAALSGAPYQPTEPGLFNEMLGSLHLDFSQFTFIDVGSGKGRTLLMAAALGFRRVIGVELLPELHNVALANIAASGKSNIESVCTDGRDYQFPTDPLVVYLFNPLPAEALEKMVENLRRSLEQHPRQAKVIYHSPLSADILADACFLTKIHSTHQYATYST